MIRIIYFIIATYLLVSCNYRSNNENSSEALSNDPTQIGLTKVSEIIISDDNLQIGRIEAPMLVSEDDGEEIFIFYDSGLNQVIITDSDGNFRQTIGRYGSGPDEFNHITSIGIDGGSLVVYDGALAKVKIFSLDGEIIDMYDGIIKDNIWLRSNRVFATDSNYYIGIQEAKYSTSNNHWESSTVAEYDKSGKLISLFGEYDPSLVKSHILYNYPNIVISDDGHVYSTHRTSYQIQKLNLKDKELVSQFGSLTESFKISDERPNPSDPRSRKNEINSKFSFVGDSFVTNEYFLFYFFNFTEEYWELRDPNDKENYFYVYNKNDEFLGEIKLKYFPLSADKNGNVYLLENDNPDNFKIGVYTIEL